MAVSTLLVQWTASTTTRTATKLTQVIRDFLQTNGWTIVDDMSSTAWNYGGQNRPSIVVTYNRNTGFTGDNPLILISTYVQSSVNYLYFYAIESWNTSTKTFTGMTSSPYAFTVISYTSNMDLLISCDSTFIVATCKVGGVRQSNQLFGVCCYERYSGDQDLGSFYGTVVFTTSGIGIPRIWHNTTAFGSNSTSSAQMNIGTIVGNNWSALSTVDEGGNDVIFPIYVHNYAYGRHKGLLYGMRVTTNSATVTDGTITGAVDGNAWYIVKSGTASGCMPYATPTVVT
jgi:hypothetical protein